MRRRAVRGVGLLALFAIAVLGSTSAASAAGQAHTPKKFDIKQQFKSQSLGEVQFLRTTGYKASPAKPISKATTYRAATDRPIPKAAGKAPSQPTDYATVRSLPIGNTPSSVVARTGITGYDQEVYGGYPLEPPDSELCAGQGTIVQVVNDQLQVFDQTGHALSPPMAMEYFLSDFTNTLTDPKCYWDPDTQHFYMTILAYPSTFDASAVYIAVSQTGNPLGNWNIYLMDTTDPFGNANCPCLADQPLLGADKWTIQISTNEFPWSGGFNGAQMFFIDKTALALGLPAPNLVAADLADVPTPDGACPTDSSGAPCFYSVQPAESPNGNYDQHFNGTSLAMSALDFFGGFDDRETFWLFTNTKSISSVSPTIFGDLMTVVTGATYANPPLAVQPPGYNPHGYWFWGADPFDVGGIETNDDRMNEVEYNYKTGWLMGGQNTGAYVTNHNHVRAAILTTAFQLKWVGSTLFLVNARSNYIANEKADVLFPASTSVNSGNGIWAYTLTGDSIYPSSAVSSFTNNAGPNRILVSNAGKGPADGFCEYYVACFPGRWGDYSGAVTDGNKVFWTSEFIDQTCTFDEYVADSTCGGTRGFFINWANSLAGTVLK